MKLRRPILWRHMSDDEWLDYGDEQFHLRNERPDPRFEPLPDFPWNCIEPNNRREEERKP